MGLAVLATLSTDRTDTLLAEGKSTVEALNSGYHLAYAIGAVLVLAAFAVAVTVLRGGAPATAGHGAPPEGGETDAPAPEPVYAEAG